LSQRSRFSLRNYLRAPIVGAGFGLLLVLSPILLGTHGFLIFFSLGGLLIVVGGVIAVAFMSFAAGDVHAALRAVLAMFKTPGTSQADLRQDMANLIKWSHLIKEKGLRNFEAGIGKQGITDPFVKYGLNMVLSEYAPDEVRRMMETAADAHFERASTPVEVLRAMTSHGPAFGMVGTLVGMVALLGNLTDNVSGIGPSLAVAFLSTLYGVLSARLVYIPAAARLRQEVESARFRHQLITEGMTMLASKKPPMHIQDRLNSFLRPEAHDYFDCFKPSAKPAILPRFKVVKA